MAFSQASNLAAILQLPMQTVGGGASAISQALNTSTAQLQTNFATASSVVKQAEALLKLKNTGEVENFSSLSRQMLINQQNGMYTASDAATGEPIADIAEADASDTSPSSLGGGDDETESFKVVISSEPNLGDGHDIVEFKVMPSITENRSVQYDSLPIIHHPGEILKYKTTSVRTWSITAKFVSRTSDEALDNLMSINTIRGWTMPYYGEGTAKDSTTKPYLGAPPQILTMSAYGDRMIGPVKCVLESYNWDFPTDVDYIATSTGVPFPVILTVSLTLKEAWSPAEHSGFDLIQYRNGLMPEAFSAVTARQSPNSAPQVTTSTEVGEPVVGSSDSRRIDTSQPTNANGPTVRNGSGGSGAFQRSNGAASAAQSRNNSDSVSNDGNVQDLSLG